MTCLLSGNWASCFQFAWQSLNLQLHNDESKLNFVARHHSHLNLLTCRLTVVRIRGPRNIYYITQTMMWMTLMILYYDGGVYPGKSMNWRRSLKSSATIWRRLRSLNKRYVTLRIVKFFPSHKAHKPVLTFVTLTFSQTSAYTARPWMVLVHCTMCFFMPILIASTHGEMARLS